MRKLSGPQVISRWIKALRSGDYPDSFSTPITVIKNDLSYNPLGVLFDLYKRKDKRVSIFYKTKGKVPNRGYRVVKMLWHDDRAYLCTLPHEIYKQIGFHDGQILINIDRLHPTTFDGLIRKLFKNMEKEKFRGECNAILEEMNNTKRCFSLQQFSHCGIKNTFIGIMMKQALAHSSENVSDDIRRRLDEYDVDARRNADRLYREKNPRKARAGNSEAAGSRPTVKKKKKKIKEASKTLEQVPPQGHQGRERKKNIRTTPREAVKVTEKPARRSRPKPELSALIGIEAGD